MNDARIQWCFTHYDSITADDLYEALALRQRVFVVEQQCAFLDADGVDRFSWHLLGRLPAGAEQEPGAGEAKGILVAYLRIVPPGRKFAEPSIGRVITAQEVRRQGYGRVLMQEGIRRTQELFPGRPIKLSAQRYLERFYGSFGFAVASEPYDEDGIPHINMVLEMVSTP
jgi:ElaA protein